MSRQAALWLLAAVAGIVIAAGITWATSQITSQHIGISSEPVSAADQLAPAETEGADRGRSDAKAHTKAAPGPSSSGLTPQAPRSSGDDGSAEGEADESGGGGASQGRDD
jgi:hypothetical protein